MPQRNCRSEAELDRLSPEDLVAYIASEREAGRAECAKRGMGVLAWAYWDTVRSIVSAKVPREDVDDVAQAAMEHTLKSAFDGKSVGEFVNWLKVISSRRVADYYRRKESRPETEPLAGQDSGDDPMGSWGVEPKHEEEGFVAVEVREAAGRVLESRESIHRMVIRLYGPGALGYDDLAPAEICERIERVHPGTGMTADNVYQIWRRFKRELHDELGLGGS